eukprot:CAMPEP_0170892720 /NCGR_PEP_ID=MMETSP0734-20130129/41900_1 /TAXON_ID=186038 /ORGANISM="Fragilariopsis kerguelensis, Strain L26-C5" /LENGTH=65 /DNA_ID=CAMNT_0011282891 /DNA_START=143 /DNA_END=340 /DNA_ORIENTATION=-
MTDEYAGDAVLSTYLNAAEFGAIVVTQTVFAAPLVPPSTKNKGGIPWLEDTNNSCRFLSSSLAAN